jgi:hypothetical protein
MVDEPRIKGITLPAMEDTQGRQLLPTLRPLLRWRYPLLTLAAFAFSFQHLRGTGRDWNYFVVGSELLFGNHPPGLVAPGGLHLYANYPNYQIGPLAFLVATPFRILGGGDGRVAAVLAMTAAAPLLVFVLEKTALAVWAPSDDRTQTMIGLTALLGGLVVVQAWAPLSTIYAHLDDVLVLTAASLTLWGVAHCRPALVGSAIGLGIAAKPWGVVALPLAFALAGQARRTALLFATAIATAAWLPFVLADPATLGAIRPAVETSPASVLHLFGVPDGVFAPQWVRPVQLGAALIAEGLALARGRWGAVLIVGIAVRIGLDPQVFLYYSAGLVLAALARDLLRSPNPLPLRTLAPFVLLHNAYVVLPTPVHRKNVV